MAEEGKEKKKENRNVAKRKTVNRRKWHLVFISPFMTMECGRCFTPAKTKPIIHRHRAVIERAYKNNLKTKLNEIHRDDNWNL